MCLSDGDEERGGRHLHRHEIDTENSYEFIYKKVLPVKMKRPLITQNSNSYENLLRLVMIENDGR